MLGSEIRTAALAAAGAMLMVVVVAFSAGASTADQPSTVNPASTASTAGLTAHS